jgi:hypothetical protein
MTIQRLARRVCADIELASFARLLMRPRLVAAAVP